MSSKPLQANELKVGKVYELIKGSAMYVYPTLERNRDRTGIKKGDMLLVLESSEAEESSLSSLVMYYTKCIGVNMNCFGYLYSSELDLFIEITPD